MKEFNTWVLNTTIYIIDFLYRGRDFQRFWVLEVIARAPYFSFISVLHFRESLGLRGEDHIYLMKEIKHSMKQNIWKRWNSGKEISIGSTGSLPSILFWFIIGSWLGIILSILLTLMIST